MFGIAKTILEGEIMKRQTASLKKWIPITECIYRSAKPVEFVTCPDCGHQSLHLEIQPYPEGDVTLYFDCLSCQLVEHISRMPVPDWMKSKINSTSGETSDMTVRKKESK
jgi:hypothetical protein